VPGNVRAALNACTIIARNYIAHARVLARSFRRHHPDGRFTVLVIDGTQPFPRESGDDFDVMVPTETGLGELELHRMAVIYDLMELATAVKPYFLKALLERDGDHVVYFDPDIEIFLPLDDIRELARQHSIVLTPHTLDPLPHDRREPGEVTLLIAGMFNLGFIAVGKGAGEFLDWWAERLTRAGHVDPGHGQFVDQRWVDFVPSLFEHAVLRDPGCNVAHWNLQTRRFERVGDEYHVNGAPLRFFHFSGYDPEKPHLLSKFLGPEPSILLSEEPALTQICSEYGAKLLASGYLDVKEEPYGFDSLPNGLPMTKRMRRLYRRALEEAERQGGEMPPDPFDPDEADRFVDWLNEPSHPEAPSLTRYLVELHAERPDLWRRFPDLRWADRDGFLEWVWTHGRREDNIPAQLMPRRESAAPVERLERGGVNVVGYFRTESGVGQASRHVIGGLRKAGIPYTTIAYAGTSSRQAHVFEDAGKSTYDVNIICVNADELLARFGYDVGPRFFRDRHSIGIWWWEVNRFPTRFHDAFTLVHEVWVGSDFIRDALAAETDKDVFTFPVGIEPPTDVVPMPRANLGLPDGFLFLFSFDFYSRFERKNPLAAVEAFRRAFEPGEGPVLLLKSINGDKQLTDLERLRAAASDRADIVVLDGYLSAAETASLTASCDCYVSLHRSEGFGLTIAEALSHGKPVIATGYSGNLMYMTDETSFLVPYRLISVPPGVDPYPEDAQWADPDLDEAARFMRKVYEDPAEAAAVGRRGREHVDEVLSLDRTAEFLEARLGEIWRARAAAPAPPPAQAARASGGLARAARYLAEGPENPIRAPSRFGPVGVFLRRVVFRLLRPYIARHNEFDSAVVAALGEIQERLGGVADAQREGQVAVERSLSDLDARGTELGGRVEDVDRRIADVRGQLVELAGQLNAIPYMADPALIQTKDREGRDRLGYSAQQAGDSSAPYRAFEDIFRGSEDFIRDRQRAYLEILPGHEPVLDVGCGRGELLDLLRAAGIAARGIDIDEGMVAHCREKGHDVAIVEATEYLSTQRDQSLGAVVALHVVEHMPYEALLRFFDLVRTKLAPSGIFVFETVNPHSIPALKTFWVDLTHEKPIFPEVALALCRIFGFESAEVFFPNGVGDLERDRREEGEYAVVAATSRAADREQRHRVSHVGRALAPKQPAGD
jgi:glycosyltransferase involved in cell wall biosynthesis/2-polyprenyl-3-methyl-5-hydroxy-6-metoxy-1,4-benzoquinol methylase